MLLGKWGVFELELFVVIHLPSLFWLRVDFSLEFIRAFYRFWKVFLKRIIVVLVLNRMN